MAEKFENRDDLEIDYLESRIEDLLDMYRHRYQALQDDQTAYEVSQSAKKSMPSDDPDEEKKRLDQIIKEFTNLVNSTKHLFTEDNEATNRYSEEKAKFENNFAAINCQIQEIRANNDGLVDEIHNREDRLTQLNTEIIEKTSLVRLLEERIYEIKTMNTN